jgi:pyrimidine operon attenuation protein / uracil phosphoribosyltransferase
VAPPGLPGSEIRRQKARHPLRSFWQGENSILTCPRISHLERLRPRNRNASGAGKGESDHSMTSNKTLDMSARDLNQTLERLTDEILANHQNQEELVLVGIRTGGAFLAQRLAASITRRTSRPVRVGVLDITLYRDDWTQLSHKPLVGKTELPGSIDGQEVVLVDDVLFTGRTIRAALDALIDYGRPRRIELAVLVDRGGRELPIQPDYVGRAMALPQGQRVNVYLTEMGRPDEVAIELGPPARS